MALLPASPVRQVRSSIVPLLRTHPTAIEFKRAHNKVSHEDEVSESLRAAARAIFAQAMAAVDVQEAVRRELSMQEGRLRLGCHTLPLHEVDRVLIVAMGKAAVPMHAAAALQLATIPCHAIVIAPIETLPPPSHVPESPVAYLPGAHPTPTADSSHAAEAIVRLLSMADARTAVLFLISGGASAMVEQPLDPAITLADVASFNRALVGSGLPIASMNALRKHLSAVKGGRLAVAAARAAIQYTLLISDVPVALPDAIASGPSLPDSTTVEQARMLIGKLDRLAIVPESIRAFFLADELPETPKENDDAFTRAHWKVILSSDHLAEAARIAAEDAGFHAVIDNSCDEWEYREAGQHLLDTSATLATQHPRSCLISVGEVAVTLPPHPGEGGRNTQFALWCATELARRKHAAAILSAGSDGIDGHSAAAGAACDATTPERAAAMSLDTQLALDRCNSGPLLRAIGDDLVTGPTGNNLRDLRLVLTDREAV
jgi:glycerate 2-kinase